jgi:hypothetical protein
MALRQSSAFITFAKSARPSLIRPSICSSCVRRASSTTESPNAESATNTGTYQQIPSPTPFVPDVPTFLSLIGRQLSQHASKFKSWDELFTLSSTELKARGLDPPRTRKYLLRWREKFRRGDYGVGGDLKYVEDGVADLRICEVPALPGKERFVLPAAEPGVGDGTAVAAATVKPALFASTIHTPGMARLVLNVPRGAKTYKLEPGMTTADLRKPNGITIKEGVHIKGSYVLPAKGGGAATIKITEGMWEDRRGHKVHGGERRRAETLHKARVAESKKNKR